MTDELNNKHVPNPGQTVSFEAIADSAAAGLELLEGEIPMSRSMRRRISLLEMVLGQIASGKAVLAPPQQQAVQSEPGEPDSEGAPEAKPKTARKRTASKRK